MFKVFPWLFRHFNPILLATFAVIFAVHVISLQDFTRHLTPHSIYSLTLDMSFEQDDESINIETYIPQDAERQQVIKESVVANGLGYLVREEVSGRVAQWSGVATANNVQYKALVATQEVEYEIGDELIIPKNYPESLALFLSETNAIQISHPEIKSLWQLIQPENTRNVKAVLRSIYNYTYQQIEGAPFKGFTDALTALRLKQASCNGKSRLFVALARLNNIPARLVGGVILNEGSKKTSHQWVEVYVRGHWIPFGPTNGNFARLPANYLSLYLTDQVLFRHTADINFDYLFSIDKRLVASSLYQIDQGQPNDSDSQSGRSIDSAAINISHLLLVMGLQPETIGLFLLFPLCTLLITFLRNVLGVKTFGVFMPMLVAAACTFTGFYKGIIAFVVILLISYLAHVILDRARLLKVPRLAAIITINTMVFIGGLSLIGTSSRLEFGMLSLFPVVIISFIAERIHQMSSDENWLELIKVSLGTLLTIWLCFLILGSFMLEALFSFYPEFYLLVLVAQIYIGRWTGLRLSELYRFKNILGNKDHPVLGINKRNRHLVYKLNQKSLLKLAADKLQSKAVLKAHDIPVPKTLLAVESLANLNDVGKLLEQVNQFALKPNQGSQGNGIMIIVDKKEGEFISASGKKISKQMISQHCAEIIAGSFSQTGDTDCAYFEPLLTQHDSLQKLAPYGLSDIRVIVSKGKVISAMLRMPTKLSDGKANLHQGAVGIAIDVISGKTTNARLKQKTVSHHPDNNQPLVDVELPFWKEIIEMSLACEKAIGLGYIGVDICIDEKLGPLVLEVNGRPGIEIQNVQNRGFYGQFQNT
ncbi:sugar-transfer associated ATP-grasp domain-containing protein [Aliikangiella coralliicola]|uniref:Transglutaminase-like domain-containing protein n=1 Tax=Aliikangiella coralliicola TaxID=2592383 RepID=A0A545U4J1_9GAMM|nr:sugar-transfer associated ATP-grasp domain-containing protein [Aliikangiella coralliicola]TQV84400.1 hypothetical protein FLL46_22525 [Aliikangiella coralliicola]